MHLDEERVQRLLHRELAPRAEASVRDHLASCSDCRSRVAEAEQEEAGILDLLRAVDHPLPRVDVESIASDARGQAPGWGRWAAGILLVLGAGVAYAAPGSPLPGLVDRLLAWAEPARQQPAPVAPPTETVEAARGIAVAPGDRFTIQFSAAQADGLAKVWLTDGAEVEVRTPSGSATFTAGLGQLLVDTEGASARFEILIPRDAPWVEIRVAGRRVYVKEASRVLTEGRQDAEGRYLLPLSLPAP